MLVVQGDEVIGCCATVNLQAPFYCAAAVNHSTLLFLLSLVSNVDGTSLEAIGLVLCNDRTLLVRCVAANVCIRGKCGSVCRNNRHDVEFATIVFVFEER